MQKNLGNLHTRDKTSCFSGVSQNPGHKHITEEHVERASPRSVEKPDQHVLQWDKTVFESQRHERGKILLNRIGNAMRRNRESVRKENSLSTMYRPTTPPRPRTPDRQRSRPDLGHVTAELHAKRWVLNLQTHLPFPTPPPCALSGIGLSAWWVGMFPKQPAPH